MIVPSDSSCHDSSVHRFGLIDSLLHHRSANGHGPPGHQATGPPGHRATGPPGHRATGPPGHRATSHQPPKVSNLWGDRPESGPCADSLTRLEPQVGGATVGEKAESIGSSRHGSDSLIHCSIDSWFDPPGHRATSQQPPATGHQKFEICGGFGPDPGLAPIPLPD